MTTWTRRRFVGGMIAGVGIAGAAAAETDDDPDPMIEFDGKPQKNPKGFPGGALRATGVVRPPAGWKVDAVTVRWQPDGAENPRVYTVVKAAVDLGRSPTTWTAQAERLADGEYWVDAHVTFITPAGERKATYTLDKRRVMIRPKG